MRWIQSLTSRPYLAVCAPDHQLAACSTDASYDANPPDVNVDTYFDIRDIAAIAGSFGQAVPTASARHDVAPDPDGFVDIADMTVVAGLFGQRYQPRASPAIAAMVHLGWVGVTGLLTVATDALGSLQTTAPLYHRAKYLTDYSHVV